MTDTDCSRLFPPITVNGGWQSAVHTESSQYDSTDDTTTTTIRTGRNFEAEYRLSATEAGEFLVELGEQLRDDDELTLESDEWELPFAFGEPVTLEIDFEGTDDPELEFELELPGRVDERAPNVS